MEINRDTYEIWFLDYAEGNLSTEQVSALMTFLEANPDLKEELEEFEMVTLPVEDNATFEGKDELHLLPTLVTMHNYEEFFIGWVENTLTAEQQASVRRFLAEHPHLEVEFRTYQKTRLDAPAVVYTAKSELQKGQDAFILNEANVEDTMIASYEGDLNQEEEKILAAWLNEKPKAKADYIAYEKVYLQAPAISFPNKASLKRKKAVVIPLWTYASVAAAVIILLVWTGVFNGSSVDTTIPDYSLTNTHTDPLDTGVRSGMSVPETNSNPVIAVEENDTPPLEDQERNTNPGPDFGTAPEQEPLVATQEQDTTTKDVSPQQDFSPVPEDDEGIAQQDPELTPVDSILPNDNEDPSGIAYSPEDSPSDDEEFLKPGELARKTVKDRLFGGKSRVGVLDVAEALTANENDQIAINDQSTDSRNAFSIKVGKFGFSHSKGKKRG